MTNKSLSMRKHAKAEPDRLLFLTSAFAFRVGIALETYEMVRPYGILVADYFFAISLVLLLCSQKRMLLFKSTGSGVLAACALILCGGLLSLVGTGGSAIAAAGPLGRMGVLFGLFAPLALVHGRNIRANMMFLIGGVSLNALIAMFSAWVTPGIIDVLAVSPLVSLDAGQDIGRFPGLAGHPNILGLSAALAILVASGLLLSEKEPYVRWALFLQILICMTGALLTGSRTFLVSLIPGLTLSLFWRRIETRAILRVSAGLIFLFLVSMGVNYLVPDLLASYTARLSATSAEDADQTRLMTAGAALVEISQKPIVGWGVEHFGEAGMVYLPADQDFMPAHVSFLHYWYAEGLAGAIGFLMLFALPFRRMLKLIKNSPAGDLTNALRVGIGAYLLLFIASNLNPFLVNRFLYVPLFMFGGLAVGVRAASSKGRIAPAPAMRLATVSRTGI